MSSAAAALANAGTTGATTTTAAATTGGEGTAAVSATATTAATTAVAATGTTTAANDGWITGIPEGETRTWVQAKGWKDTGALAESAYNLEKLIGFDKAGRTLVIPKDDAPPEERKAFLQKLGVPETPDAYKIAAPEGMPPEYAKSAAEAFHKAGLTPKQAAELVEWNNKQVSEHQTALQQAAAAEADKQFNTLITEWGKDADSRLELGRRAAAQFIPAADPKERQAIMSKLELAIGTKTMLSMFAEMGRHLGEHPLHGNGNPGQYGATTPAQAQAKIEALKQDPVWSKAYVSGDKNKLKEMSDLMAVAYGSTSPNA